MPLNALDSMMSSMIGELDREFLKPVTLKRIVDYARSRVVEINRNSGHPELKF